MHLNAETSHVPATTEDVNREAVRLHAELLAESRRVIHQLLPTADEMVAAESSEANDAESDILLAIALAESRRTLDALGVD